METIQIHSMVDMITNSSTEFYTDFSNSLQPCKDLINEILNLDIVTGLESTILNCDDIFNIYLKNTNYDDYVSEGIIDPITYQWEPDECNPAMLIIEAKNPRYENLAKKLKIFLQSGESKEFMS